MTGSDFPSRPCPGCRRPCSRPAQIPIRPVPRLVTLPPSFRNAGPTHCNGPVVHGCVRDRCNPNVTGGPIETNHAAIFYKRLIRNYVGLHNASSPQDKVFACPADTFYYDFPSLTYEPKSLHNQPDSDYSSYGFSGGNGFTNAMPPPFLDETSWPGVFGLKQTSVKGPTKTVLLMEISGFFPWSWHQPQRLPPTQYGLNNAKNMVSFVDGHTDYIRIFWNPAFRLTSCCYDPPVGYDYKLSAN